MNELTFTFTPDNRHSVTGSVTGGQMRNIIASSVRTGVNQCEIPVFTILHDVLFGLILGLKDRRKGVHSDV